MSPLPIAAPRLPSLPEPDAPRWQVLRAGLQNLWEYDDQRFVFHRGRLLLRGRNESGKTKALELLLPFLLDADLSPQRLDPFGSMSRPMRWNLINDHNPEVQVSIGYAWLELGRRGEAGTETCTVGAKTVFQARKARGPRECPVVRRGRPDVSGYRRRRGRCARTLAIRLRHGHGATHLRQSRRPGAAAPRSHRDSSATRRTRRSAEASSLNRE